jgi:hypothetical protein
MVVKLTSAVIAWLGVASVSAIGCGGTKTAQATGPVVITAPNDFVLRDVRKDAARHLACEVPNVTAVVGPWAGAEGNVTAYGCGYEINYYLRCITSHQCSLRVTD